MSSNTAGRRQSTRQVRNTGIRNYYDRNRGIDSAGPRGANNDSQPGFFPAITHFTEAIESLPKEVVRHFSMLKEVEAKLHAPDEQLRHLADSIEKLPARSDNSFVQAQTYFPSLSSQNSINGSRNGSIVGPSSLGQDGQNGQDEAADRERQELFYRLSFTIASAAPVLDEKIALLSTANSTLAKCLERMESSYLHIPEEVSDEARLGNPKHWAYVTDKETKKAAPERARREVANHGVSALVAAVDSEIAQRSETRREAVAARKNRAQHIDSDFDDKPPPKKGPGKGRKSVVDDAKTLGLGITNGAGGPNKRRKVAGAPPMERTISGALAGNIRGGQASPRETPEVGAPGKKRAKQPGPVPKRRNIGAQSPGLVASPVVTSFAHKDTIQKPQSSRGRQSSSTAVHATPVETLRGRPSSSASNKPANGMASLSAIEQVQTSAAAGAESPCLEPTVALAEPTAPLKHEDAEMAEDATMADAVEPPVVVTTRAGRQSKTATPISNTFPTDLTLGPRNRSARTQKEKDNTSVAHSHASSESGERTSGRRKKSTINSATQSTLGPAADDIDPDTELPGVEIEEGVEVDEDDEEAEGGEGEPKYCYCNDVSYGEMVACDNESCAREWFHLKCAGLTKAPDENTKWYCDDCKIKMGVVGALKRNRPAVRRE